VRWWRGIDATRGAGRGTAARWTQRFDAESNSLMWSEAMQRPERNGPARNEAN